MDFNQKRGVVYPKQTPVSSIPRTPPPSRFDTKTQVIIILSVILSITILFSAMFIIFKPAPEPHQYIYEGNNKIEGDVVEVEFSELAEISPDQDELNIPGTRPEVEIQNPEKTEFQSLAGFYKGPSPDKARITTDVVAVEPMEIGDALIRLPKNGPVDKIIMCNDFDFDTFTCLNWEVTDIPFIDYGDYIEFRVDHFSAYAGAQITIINVQSYPTVGGNWEVRFTTQGTADLTIEAIEETTWSNTNENEDLKLLEVKCGETVQTYQWIDDPVYTIHSGQGSSNKVLIEDYTCEEEGTETSLVLTPGVHNLKFTFGGDVGYANNLAGRDYDIVDLAKTIFTGADSNQQFGYTFDSAGDVNNDSYDDLIIGEYSADYGGNTDAGRAYLIYGPIAEGNFSMPINATWYGTLTTQELGRSVAGVGDVNNDGYDDFMVSSRSGSQGVAFIIYGQSAPFSGEISIDSADASWLGEANSAYLGHDAESISGAGDVNNDSYDDILIGSALYNVTPNTEFGDEGKVYLILGRPTKFSGALGDISNSANASWYGEIQQGGLGWSVDSAGDFDGDGYDDILMGAHYYGGTGGGDYDGRVYMIRGCQSCLNNDPDNNISAADIIWHGDYRGFAGQSVAGAGNVDNDNYDDILIGSPTYSSARGGVYLIKGPVSNGLYNLSNSSNYDIRWVGEQTLHYLGESVAGPGDINNDGYDDILMMAPRADQTTNNNETTKTYLFYGGPSIKTTLAIADFSFIGENITTSGGWIIDSMARGAGDTDGDGFPEILVSILGTPTEDKVYLLGNTPPNTTLVFANFTASTNYTTDNLTCYANVTDADDQGVNVTINYKWYNDTAEVYSGQSSIPLDNFSYVATLTSGNTSKWQNFTCSIMAANPVGFNETDWNNATTITVRNEPPSVTLILPSNGANVDQTLPENFTWSFSDPDNDAQHTFNIVVDDDSDFTSPEHNVTIISSDTNHSLSMSQAHVTYYWKVKANDTDTIENGQSAFSSTFNFWSDIPPNTTQVFVNTTLGNNYTDENLQCYAQAVDAYNTTLIAYYKWYKEGIEQSSGSTTGIANDTLSLVATLGSGSTTRFDNWTCSVKFFDGQVNETDWNDANITILNKPPQTTLVYPYNNSQVSVTGPITFRWTYFDGDSDPQSGYEIIVDNNSDFSSPEVNVTNITAVANHTASLTQNNMTYYWKVRTNDTYGAWSDYTATGVFQFVSGDPPNTVQIILNSTGLNYTTTDDLTCYAEGSDAEQSSLTAHFKWYKDSVEQVGLAGSTAITTDVLSLVSTLGSGNTSAAQTWTCSIRMDDGYDNETDWNNASQKIGSVCGETLSDDTQYILTADTTETGSNANCFTINGDNIELDCQGYRMTATGSALDTAQAISQQTASAALGNNFTLKNCFVQDFEYGVYRYFSDSTFYNNTFNSSYRYSISFRTYDDNNITGNTFVNQDLGGGWGSVYLDSDTNDISIYYNNFSNNQGFDIRISGPGPHEIKHNIFDKNSINYYVIEFISDTPSALFENNTMTNIGTGASSFAFNLGTTYQANATFIGTNLVDGENASEYYIYGQEDLVLDGLHHDGARVLEGNEMMIVNSNNITIRNSNFTNHPAKNNLYIYNSNNTNITNNNISKKASASYYSLHVTNSDVAFTNYNITIDNNEIKEYTYASAVRLERIDGITMTNNDIRASGTVVFIDRPSEFVIENNQIYSPTAPSSTALLVTTTTDDDNGIIQHNNISGARTVLRVDGPTNSGLTNMTIYNNTLAFIYTSGVGINPGDGIMNISNNTITCPNSGTGFQIGTTTAGNHTISSNTINNCQKGFRLINGVAVIDNNYITPGSVSSHYGFEWDGSIDDSININITRNNYVEGKTPPYYYYEDNAVLSDQTLNLTRISNVGVFIRFSNDVVIDNNTIFSNDDNNAHAIAMLNSSDLNITSNNITDFNYGIRTPYADGSSTRTYIAHNSINSIVSYGISFPTNTRYNENWTVYNNTFNDMGPFGIYLWCHSTGTNGTSEMNISSNNFYDGASNADLHVQNCDFNTFANNFFNNSAFGINLVTAHNNTLENNRFEYTTNKGIQSSSSDNLIKDNNFTKHLFSSTSDYYIHFTTAGTTGNNITGNLFNGTAGHTPATYNDGNAIYYTNQGANNPISFNEIYSMNIRGIYVTDTTPSYQGIFNNTVCYNKEPIEFGSGNTLTTVGWNNNSFCIDNLWPVNGTFTNESTLLIQFNASNLVNYTSTNCTALMNGVSKGYNDTMGVDGSNQTIQTSALTDSQYELNITCTDDFDSTAVPNSITFEVQANIPPNTTQIILNASGQTGYTDEDLTCYANGTDDTNATIIAYYKWYNNSVEQTSLAGSTAISSGTLSLVSTLASGNTTTGETWICSILVGDGALNETDWNNASLTIASQVPTHTTPVLNSSSATNTTAENLTCYNQSSNDPESLPIKNIFNWYSTGGLLTVLNMPFEGGSDSTSTNDYSGFANQGTVEGATYSSTGGYDGFGAYQFDGGTDYIDVGSDVSLNLSNEISVMAWIKSDSEGFAVVKDPVGDQYNFTTCGQTGITGPNQSQCDTNYTGGTLDGLVTVGDGIQNWTVPATGTYTIEAWGAEGGISDDGPGGNTRPGRGARIKGDFELTAGQVLQILVAQEGEGGTAGNQAGGGGGGSFVVNSTNGPLLIAGGGSGENWLSFNTDGTDGRIDNDGDVGGTRVSGRGGGGGSLSNDGSDYNAATRGGLGFINNGSGGIGQENYGGFGGGGGARYEGGGGGGYNGGNVINSNAYNDPEPTGAGSYNNGTDQNNTAGNNTGDGKVTITLTAVSKDDVPFALSTMGGGEFLIKNDSYTISSSTDLNDGNWHHVAATYTSGNMSIYVDGVVENSSSSYSGNIPTNEDSVLIGRHWDPDNSSNYFNGSIDEVLIYNISLSPEQVLAIYQNRTDLIVSQETSIGDNWTCTVTIHDESQNGSTLFSNNLTVLAASSYPCGLAPLTANTTLTQNYTNDGTGPCITMAADNITLDCAGYWLEGINLTTGILATDLYNITINNCSINNFTVGINASNSSVSLGNLNITNIGLYGFYSNPHYTSFDGNNFDFSGPGTYLGVNYGGFWDGCDLVDIGQTYPTPQFYFSDLTYGFAFEDCDVNIQGATMDFTDVEVFIHQHSSTRTAIMSITNTDVTGSGSGTAILAEYVDLTITGLTMDEADVGLHIQGASTSSTIDGITIVGTSTAGIILENTTNITIDNATISNFTIGINITNVTNFTINNTNITNVTHGLWIESSENEGVDAVVSEASGTYVTIIGSTVILILSTPDVDPAVVADVGVEVIDSTVTIEGAINAVSTAVIVSGVASAGSIVRSLTASGRSINGIYLENTTNITIDQVSIDNFTVGINITNSTNSTINNTNITNVTYGVYIDPSSGITINNVIAEGRGSGTGITYIDSSGDVRDSEAENFDIGISVDAQSTTTLDDNKFWCSITSDMSVSGTSSGDGNYCKTATGHQDDTRTEWYSGDNCQYQDAICNEPSWRFITGFDNTLSTDIGAQPDMSAVDLVLAGSGITITYPNPVDIQNYDFNPNIIFGAGYGGRFVSVSSTTLPTLNSQHLVCSFGTNCEAFNVWRADGYETSFSALKAAGTKVADETNIGGDCDSDCTDVTCSGGMLCFNDTGWSGYAIENSTSLVIWDETDSTTKYTGEQVKFYANYSNTTDGSPITGAVCNASFQIAPAGPSDMTYNATSTFYEFNRSFSSAATTTWNVSCSATNFASLNTSDTVTVTAVSGPIPEFSTYAMILALIITICGFIVARKKLEFS